MHAPSRVSLRENLAVGSFVTQIQATDSDSGSNSKLVFTVVPELLDHPYEMDTFRVNSSTGVVSLGLNLDSTQTLFTVPIEVADCANIGRITCREAAGATYLAISNGVSCAEQVTLLNEVIGVYGTPGVIHLSRTGPFVCTVVNGTSGWISAEAFGEDNRSVGVTELQHVIGALSTVNATLAITSSVNDPRLRIEAGSCATAAAALNGQIHDYGCGTAERQHQTGTALTTPGKTSDSDGPQYPVVYLEVDVIRFAPPAFGQESYSVRLQEDIGGNKFMKVMLIQTHHMQLFIARVPAFWCTSIRQLTLFNHSSTLTPVL